MQIAHRQTPPGPRVPVGVVSAVSMLLLGAIAAGVSVELIPRLLSIESSCITSQGWTRSDGDSYFGTVVVVGTFGWLGVGVATIYASIAERRSAVLLLPVAWFIAFLTFAFTMAAAIGPAPCTA
jgi:hypothetical protein